MEAAPGVVLPKRAGGVSELTYQIWFVLRDAGTPGLTRVELRERVRAYIPVGEAYRQYEKLLTRLRKTNSSRSNAHFISMGFRRMPLDPEVSDTRRKACDYLFGQRLNGALAGGVVLVAAEGQLIAGRAPKMSAKRRELYDPDLSKVREHVTIMEATRTLRDLRSRATKRPPGLRVAEWESIWTLLDHYDRSNRQGPPP